MNDERERERTAARLQELLESDLGNADRAEIERWAAATPERAEELERLRRLDGLLAEAVPEIWSPEWTERVLASLDLAPDPDRGRGRVLRIILTAAAAIIALAVWGGPVLARVQAAPGRIESVGAGLLDGLTDRTLALPSFPAGPVAGAAIVVLLVTFTVGARTARGLSNPERDHE